MFIYTIVNIGSEKLLKEEVSIKYPYLKFAYSRPGYITFKDTSESFTLETKLDLIFARAYGLTLGKFSKENIEEEIKNYKDKIIHRFSYITNEYSGEKAMYDREILDVMEIKEGEFWLGLRKVRNFTWFYPFANPFIEMSKEAPTRDYLKLVEAFIWTNFKSDGSETVLELGSAPGGMSFAMVSRGLKVYGVDSGIMSDIVLNNSLFTHIKDPMQKVRDNRIPRPCNILVVDVNLTPKVTLPQIKRFTSLRPGIKRVFYTLKMGEKISVSEVLEHVKTFTDLGFFEVGVTQLPSHKSEILIYGKRK